MARTKPRQELLRDNFTSGDPAFDDAGSRYSSDLALAEALRCGEETVRLIRTGQRLPGLLLAARMADVIRVPIETWLPLARERAWSGVE